MSNYFDDSGLTMFQCDVCGRKLNTINYTNGMKFCAKCYQETFGSKITEDMLIDMIKKTGWTLSENKDFLTNIDKETTILNQQRRISELEEQLKNATKQVRKEVIEQIKDYMESHSHTIPIDTKNRKVIYKIGLTRFLDQLEEYN